MTALGQWPLSVEATLGMALLLSEGLMEEDKAKLLRRPHGYLSMPQRKLGLGGFFSAQGSAWQDSKSRGCGAKPRAEAWLFLLLAGQPVSNYFTLPNLSSLLSKTGIILPTS